MAERQPWTPGPPVPEFVARCGTGHRHRVRRWQTSLYTNHSVKLVTPAQTPGQKMVFVLGDSHLRAIVNRFVSMPQGSLSFGFLSVPGGAIADLWTEVMHAALPWTLDLVCVGAPSNNLTASRTVALQDLLRQEYRRVTARMGIPYVSMAEHLPVHRLELWCYDGVHLSDSDGMPVVVDLLWNAEVRQLAPPPPQPTVSHRHV
ncbi:uncharacterized protein ACBR49_002661 isoform 2-T2 [Aulostomus maculatus]